MDRANKGLATNALKVGILDSEAWHVNTRESELAVHDIRVELLVQTNRLQNETIVSHTN